MRLAVSRPQRAIHCERDRRPEAHCACPPLRVLQPQAVRLASSTTALMPWSCASAMAIQARETRADDDHVALDVALNRAVIGWGIASGADPVSGRVVAALTRRGIGQRVVSRVIRGLWRCGPLGHVRAKNSLYRRVHGGARSLGSQGWAVLRKAFLIAILPLWKVNTSTMRFHAAAVFGRAGEGGLGHAAITDHEVIAVDPLRIGEVLARRLQSPCALPSRLV